MDPSLTSPGRSQPGHRPRTGRAVGTHFPDRIIGSDETHSISFGLPGDDVIDSGLRGANMLGSGGAGTALDAGGPTDVIDYVGANVIRTVTGD